MAFELGSVLPGYRLAPASGVEDDRVIHLLVGNGGETFGLVRSYADPALFYAVRVEAGVRHEPATIDGHRWFREIDGVVRPVAEPPRALQRRARLREWLAALGTRAGRAGRQR